MCTYRKYLRSTIDDEDDMRSGVGGGCPHRRINELKCD